MRTHFASAIVLCLLVALSSVQGLRTSRIQLDDPGVDWRTAGKVTTVKNQFECNCSYAFAVADNIASRWAVVGHTLRNLSTQELISCGSGGGCTATTSTSVTNTLNWLINHNEGKIYTSDSVPFTSYHGNVAMCDTQHGVVGGSISSIKHLSTNEAALASYVQTNGPIVAMIDDTNLRSYYTGIWTGCPAQPVVNHAVLIVGYSDGSSPYWIVKNSWGADWGLEGYAKIPLGTNACGIANMASTVETTGATLPPSPAPPETRTPSPPIPPPTPPPPVPPTTATPAPSHYTYAPGATYAPGSNVKYTVSFCSDSACSTCDTQKNYYQGECSWQTGWSFKAWCDGSHTTTTAVNPADTQKINLNVYPQAKCAGIHQEQFSQSHTCFAPTGAPPGTYLKIDCNSNSPPP